MVKVKVYRCPGCGFEIRTGPYAWMLDIEEELESTGRLTCPRCKKGSMARAE